MHAESAHRHRENIMGDLATIRRRVELGTDSALYRATPYLAWSEVNTGTRIVCAPSNGFAIYSILRAIL